KDAILKSRPEDIVMTTRVSETPASVIRTDYIEKIGTDLPWVIEILKKQKTAKKFITPLIHYLGMRTLDTAATKPTWKTVWSAGQGVGLIDEVLSCKEIMEKFVTEYFETTEKLP